VELEVIDIHDELFNLINQLDYILVAHHNYIMELADNNSEQMQNELSGFYNLQVRLLKDFRAYLLALDPHIDILSSLRVENN